MMYPNSDVKLYPVITSITKPSHGDSNNGALCETCQAIFSRSTQPEDGKLYPHHTDETHFRAAAAAGCSMCLSLIDEIEVSTTKETSPAATITRYNWSLTFDFGDHPVAIVGVSLFRSLFLKASSNDPAASKQRKLVSRCTARFELWPTTAEADNLDGRPDSLKQTNTSSSLCIDLAESWLHSCKQRHKRCRVRKQHSKWVPSRLVDLDAEKSREGRLRIVETDKEPIDADYMTVSHRWGPHRFPMFNERNRERMIKGFDAASLPQTFQDTIQIVRRFGVRYLWVDCLCILQENVEDFRKEAGLMHQVYGNSYCNICATGARDNSESLFHDRDPRSLEPQRLELGWLPHSSHKYTLFNSELWKHSVFGRPVNRRAWVMQERFLAPCVLHFGKQQLFWECREVHACEQYPSGLPEAIMTRVNDLKTLDLLVEEDRNSSNKSEVYQLWNMLLFTYTRCGLTEASDKLIALAGIATQVHQTLNDTYLAGLWQSYLMYDMLWQIDDVRTGITRPLNYRAPSWSWASVDGPLYPGGKTPMHPSAQLSCSILEMSTGLASSNPFGSIKSGMLRIKARLKKLSIVHDMLKTSPVDWHLLARTGPSCGTKINDVWCQLIVIFDDAPAAPTTENMWCFCVRQEEQEEDDLLFDDEDDGSDSEMRSSNNQDMLRTIPFRYGLIVTPTGRQEGEFQRLGVFSFADDRLLTIFENSIADDEKDWPCNAYDETERLHTFTMV